MRRVGIRILLVDDDQSLRAIIAMGLRLREHIVEEAADGAEAEAIFSKAVEEGPAVDQVITDLVMPGIDGIELVKRIKAKSQETPVCVVSGTLTPACRILIERAGGGPALEKPFTLDKLCLALNI